MWKIVVGFVLFAALSLFVIMKAGDKVDMSGEKHSGDVAHAPAPAAPASTVVPPAASAASAASAAK